MQKVHPLPYRSSPRRSERSTSLKRQLIVLPILVLFVGVVATVGLVVMDARARISAEIGSGMRLGEDLVTTALRNVANAASPAQAFEQLNQDLPRVRHVEFQLVPADSSLLGGGPLLIALPGRPPPAWITWLLAPPPEQERFHVVVRGAPAGEIRLRSNPADEIAEITDELALFCGAPVVLCFILVGMLLWTLQRSLRSVQPLMDGLDRLARGDYRPVPPIAVRELRRIGELLNVVMHALQRLTNDNHLLVGRLISVQEQERKDLATDLHDEFGPALFGIRAEAACLMKLDSSNPRSGERLREHARAIGALTDGMQKVNSRILDRLRPLVLEQMGVQDAMRELVAAWRARHAGIAWSLSVDEPLRELSEECSLVLYRVAQEAVTNAMRHSGASAIEIRVERRLGATTKANDLACVVLSVSDNGNGLATGSREGFGILGMRERVHQIGGHLTISPATPTGVVMRAFLPERPGDGQEPSGARAAD